MTTTDKPLVLLWIPDPEPDNLERFLAGQPLRETVDRAKGY